MDSDFDNLAEDSWESYIGPGGARLVIEVEPWNADGDVNAMHTCAHPHTTRIRLLCVPNTATEEIK
jgi:hypothetical protein